MTVAEQKAQWPWYVKLICWLRSIGCDHAIGGLFFEDGAEVRMCAYCGHIERIEPEAKP